jgi:hypothetical protein
MIATYFGQAFVKVQVGETVFAFNPISKASDPKATKFGADVALISLNDPAFNGKENVAFGSKEPFYIEGPGEYEIGGTFIRGFETVGPDGKINTVYTVIVDGIRLCHLGGLANASLPPETIEDLGVIDILFVPIGGGDYLAPKDAAKLAAALEAKMVVPVLFNADSLKTFLKEWGVEKEISVDKLSVKKRDVDGKEGELVVIKS